MRGARRAGEGAGSAPARGGGARHALAASFAALLFALPVASASAAPTTIAAWGHGAGKVNAPKGVDVDQSTGDLYVAEAGNFRIDRFDSAGNFLLAWGYGVADGKSEALQVCGPAAEPPTKRCFATNFNSAGGGNPENNLHPDSVAVDNDPASSSYHDVYVAESSQRRIAKFTLAGSLISFLGPDVTLSGPGDTGADETQTLTVKATAGTFTLSLTAPASLGKVTAQQTTAPIPYNASHEALQAALEALPGVEAGDLSVSGGPGDASGSAPYEVHFEGGAFAGNYVAKMGAGAGALTGSATLAISVPGGGPEVCEPGRGDICKAAAGSGAIPGELVAPSSLAFDSEGKLWVNDGGNRAQRFDADGSFLEEVALPAGTRSNALAIDPISDDFYLLGPQGRNELQLVGAFCSKECGEFTLTFEGQTTEKLPVVSATSNPADLNYELSLEVGEAIEAALEALSTIGKGNVRVVPLFQSFRVSFIHDLGGRDVPLMSASGGSPPVAVSGLAQGMPGSVLRLDSAGAPLDTLDDELGDLPNALANDSEGNLYVGDAGYPYHLLRYDSAGNLISIFAAGQVIGGGIFSNSGPEGNALVLDLGSEAPGEERPPALYAASSQGAPDNEVHAGEKAAVAVQRFDLPAPGPLIEGQRAIGVLPTEATLKADLNPEGHETTYRFEYDTSPYEGEAEHGTKVPVPDATLAGEGFDSEAVEVPLAGLTPDTAYHFRLVATDHGDPHCVAEECTTYGEDTAFRIRTAVGIEDEWASAVAAHDATLNATLDPLGAAHAAWWVEYDTSPYGEGEAPHGTKASALDPSLPAAEPGTPLHRALALTGLAPATAYHYRFVAEGDQGGATYTTYGPDRAFATQPVGGFALPDSRAWEMVSPPDKAGGRVAPNDGTQGGQVQAAADGEALAYISDGSLEPNPEGNRLIEQSSELARRGAGGVWTGADITPPHTAVTFFGAGTGLEYKLFSSNLGRALLEPRDCTPLSPAATERTPYLRENSSPPAYTPLVTTAPVPFGGSCGANAGEVHVQGAGADLSHVVLQSFAALTAGAPKGALYEWAGETLEPLSVEPAGEGGALVSADLGSGAASVGNAISADGSRVFFTTGGLYARDTESEETVRLDTVQPGAFGTGKADPLFQGASADGSLAFFTDTQNLTPDANEEGADLYRWRAQGSGGCGAAGGCLADLSAQTASFGEPQFGESAEVQGLLPGIAADGSAAYFVARGVLDPEPNAQGEGAGAGQPNLYLWREGRGVRFLATLSAEGDFHDWGIPDPLTPSQRAANLTAAASPSGRYLAFMSERPLSGYDNRDATGGERVQEVFAYDAATEALACVSCDPGGERPHALVAGPAVGQLGAQFDPQFLWTGQKVAAAVPEATSLTAAGASLYRPRYVHDDGRVFFNAADSLVAADSNGDGDVYEFEPFGVGSCGPSAAGAGTALLPGACVSLISSGHAEGTAAFLDASAGGSDVFFYSPGRLAVTDEDSELDVYDARVDGEPAVLHPVAECLGEACQPPYGPPVDPTPASSAFDGAGNVREEAKEKKRCPKGRRKVRRKGKVHCAKTRKHRTHRKHGRRRGRAGHHGRTSR